MSGIPGYDYFRTGSVFETVVLLVDVGSSEGLAVF